MRAKTTFALAAAITLAMPPAACKINKDTNCLNRKAECFKKDTEQPSIIDTSVESTITNASPQGVGTLPSFVVTFSEPMLNADKKSYYPNPVGSGSNGMSIASVTKLADRSYQINMAGTPSFGPIDFNFSALTDLSGNGLTNPQFTIQGGAVGISNSFVGLDGGTGTGYGNTVITWKNNNPVPVAFQFKKGGTSCASGATNIISGSSLSSPPQAPVYNGTLLTEMSTTINRSEITTNPTVIRICMTDAGSGLDQEVTFNIGLDNSVPTTTPSQIAGTVFEFPANVTLACASNADIMGYKIDGPTPGIAPGPPSSVNAPASLYTASGITVPKPASLAERTRVLHFRCMSKAGVIEPAKTATYNAQLQWADQDLKSERWDWAYWK